MAMVNAKILLADQFEQPGMARLHGRLFHVYIRAAAFEVLHRCHLCCAILLRRNPFIQMKCGTIGPQIAHFIAENRPAKKNR